MNRLFKCFALLFLCFYTSIAQESLRKHTVSSGETLFSIAKKYNVTPYDLQKVNPEVINGIKVDEVLLIPEGKIKTPILESAADSIKSSVTSSSISYTVKTGETKFSVSKRFGLTITALESQNPQIIEGLHVGDVLEIYPTSSYTVPTPSNTTTTTSNSSPTASPTTRSSNGKRHLVVSGETLFRIANANGLTVDQLVDANSRVLSRGLIVGQTIWIPSSDAPLVSGTHESYTVKNGDTKFGLSRRFNTTIRELERHNPHIKNMLEIGHVITMPSAEEASRPNETAPIATVNDVEETETVSTITETVVSTEDQPTATETLPTVPEAIVTTENQHKETETVPTITETVVTTEEQPTATKTLPTVTEVVVTVEDQPIATETLPTVTEVVVTVEDQPTATETLPTVPEAIVTVEDQPTTEPLPTVTEVVVTVEDQPTTNTLPTITEVVVTSEDQLKETETPPIVPEVVVQTQPIENVGKSKVEETVATTAPLVEKTETPAEAIKSNTSESGYLPYTVQPHDTLYGLAQKAGMSTADFLVLNPQLKESVQIGTVIKMPDAVKPAHALSETISPQDLDRDFSIPVDLRTSANTSQLKKVLFFLPFSQVEYQSHEPTNYNFNTVSDDFKRVNLEFYKGANIAIDSIRKMYLTLDVDVIEAQSSIRASKIKPLLEEGHINDYDAIILPFYDTVEEEVAAFTADSKVPVITASPIDFQSTTNNLYSAVPSINLQRKKVLDYMMAKGAHIIVLNDAGRTESKAFIAEYAPNAEFVNIKKNGSFSEDELLGKFKKGQPNYVVIDSERNSVFLNTTNILMSQLSNYTLQLAVLESELIPAEGAVSEKRFRILNMVFPSLIPAKSTASSKQFLSSYQKKYNLLPSANVMLGFDITFDSLLRLIQQQPFENSAANDITEYTQLKFNYEKNNSGGFSNEGMYILQYDSEANIREAN